MNFTIIIIILALIVFAWCPWLKPPEAQQLVDVRVQELQNQYTDLCAMTIHKDTLSKVPFGYSEKVSYDCTVTDSLYGIQKSTNTVFITFYKGLIGFPVKTIKNNLQ